MKMITPLLENPVILTCPSSLCIEDNHLFSNVISSIMKAQQDKSEPFYLFDSDEKELSPAKDIKVILSPFDFDFNSKDIQNKIFSICELNINSDTEKQHIMEQYYSTFIKSFVECADLYENNFDIELEFDIKKILKFLGVKINYDNSCSLFEKTLQIIEIIAQLKLSRLIVFVNLKLYFNNEEVEQIYKTAIYNQINLLTIEQGKPNEILKYEKSIYIDKDYYWEELSLKN